MDTQLNRKVCINNYSKKLTYLIYHFATFMDTMDSKILLLSSNAWRSACIIVVASAIMPRYSLCITHVLHSTIYQAQISIPVLPVLCLWQAELQCYQ